MMKIYLVGGAIRDKFLDRDVKDHDFVVVGATENEMLDLGFNKVGADFPVFLHPLSGEEFALARKERKVAAGYNGFDVDFDPSVTLEEDLVRRDLTINAMAAPAEINFETGDAIVDWDNVIDPFNGRGDLEANTLRHVSEAFAEDPVRVLRVARFAARFGFNIALETLALMTDLVEDGELDHLVSERVWTETERALTEEHPMAFFVTLDMCGAADRLFPEFDLDDGFIETNLANTPASPRLRFALACLKLTDSDVNLLCDRLKVPTDYKRFALNGNVMSELFRNDLTPERVVSALERIGAFQEGNDNEALLVLMFRSAFNTEAFLDRRSRFACLLPDVIRVRFADLTIDQQDTLKGPEVGAALRELRLQQVAKFL